MALQKNQLSEMVMHPAAKSDQVANGFICWEGGARFLYDNHIAKEPKPMKPRMSSFRLSILNGLFQAFRWWNDSKQSYNVGGVKKRGSSGSSFIRSRLRSLFLSPAIFAPFIISLRFTH